MAALVMSVILDVVMAGIIIDSFGPDGSYISAFFLHNDALIHIVGLLLVRTLAVTAAFTSLGGEEVIDTKLSSLSGRVKYRYRCSISKVQVVESLVNRESDCLLVQDDAWSGSWMLPQFGSASNVCFVPRSAVLGGRGVPMQATIERSRMDKTRPFMSEKKSVGPDDNWRVTGGVKAGGRTFPSTCAKKLAPSCSRE
eukprot:scaffold3852_cov106-Skeletonema_marinoi.AAC.1